MFSTINKITYKEKVCLQNMNPTLYHIYNFLLQKKAILIYIIRTSDIYIVDFDMNLYNIYSNLTY